MTIDVILVRPSRTDTWEVFSDKADQLLVDLSSWTTQANALAAEMNQELVDALSASVAGITGTSTTSLSIGTGTKNLTVTTVMDFVPGMTVVLANTTTPTTQMVGTVVSYNSGTGALAVNVTSYTGSGTYAAWTISLTYAISFDGRTYQDLRLAGKLTEAVYAVTGTTPVIDPVNGMTQTWVLSGNSTPTANFASAAGESRSITLMIRTGAYTLTWGSMAITWVSNKLPPAVTSGYAVCILWTVGSTLYGAYIGSVT